ncbi:hypothetical protein D3C87_2181080 [compost metagenome]
MVEAAAGGSRQKAGSRPTSFLQPVRAPSDKDAEGRADGLYTRVIQLGMTGRGKELKHFDRHGSEHHC